MTLAAILMLASVVGEPQSIPPPFDRYPAERRLSANAKSPSLSSRRARRYRTVLRDAAAQGVNFNGHYRVASWGCGTNCLEWAIIDLETGKVWFAAEPAGSCSGGKDQDSQKVPDWFDIHLDSSLLILNECHTAPVGDHIMDTRQLFVWRHGSLHHVRDEPLHYWNGDG